MVAGTFENALEDGKSGTADVKHLPWLHYPHSAPNLLVCEQFA